MNTQNLNPTQDATLLLTQRVGSLWRCMLVNRQSSTPTIIETAEVNQDASLESLIESHEPDQIYVVLSGSQSVCRTTTLPDVDQDQIVEALRLQAEARFLGTTPSHRRVMAPLDSAVGETNRVGLIIAWPEQQTIEVPTCLDEACFIPDTVALAALLDGIRPTEPMLIANPADGSVSIAISHANGAAIRATKEDNSSIDTFKAGLLSITRETAEIHNHSASFVNGLINNLEMQLASFVADDPIVILPEVITEHAGASLAGCESSNDWWKTWGILAGSTIAATGLLEPLTTLKRSAPEINPSFAEKVTQSLESPRLVKRLITAAVVCIIFGPALLAGIRLGLLEMLNPNVSVQYALRVESKQEQIVYKELEKSAWPMSKLIADVTNHTPVGIDLESIRIDIGEPISVRGRALSADGMSAAELIAKYQESLQSTGIFKDVQFSYDTAGTYGDRDFDLWATVADPLRRPRLTQDEDFGVWTLAMRQDGIQPEELDPAVDVVNNDDGSSPLGTADAEDVPSSDPIRHAGDSRNDVDRPRNPRNTSTGDNGTASRSETPNASGAPSSRVPEPLTAEQIGNMSADEARIALKDVTEGLNHVGRDAEAKARLRSEMRMLLDRLKEVRN